MRRAAFYQDPPRCVESAEAFVGVYHRSFLHGTWSDLVFVLKLPTLDSQFRPEPASGATRPLDFCSSVANSELSSKTAKI